MNLVIILMTVVLLITVKVVVFESYSSEDDIAKLKAFLSPNRESS